jgi:hypothetical protein
MKKGVRSRQRDLPGIAGPPSQQGGEQRGVSKRSLGFATAERQEGTCLGAASGG